MLAFAPARSKTAGNTTIVNDGSPRRTATTDRGPGGADFASRAGGLNLPAAGKPCSGCHPCFRGPFNALHLTVRSDHPAVARRATCFGDSCHQLFSRIAGFVYFELPVLVCALVVPSFPVPTPLSQPPADRPAAASARAIVDHGFVPVRANLIEVAAFLDRVDRHVVSDDFRCVALRDAAALLVDGQPERARRILEKLSDPTTEPVAKSSGKAALGAWHASASAESPGSKTN
jgi:hypothetical protein